MSSFSGLNIIQAYGSDSEESENGESIVNKTTSVTPQEVIKNDHCQCRSLHASEEAPIPFKKSKMIFTAKQQNCLRCANPICDEASDVIQEDFPKAKSFPSLPSVPKNILEMFSEAKDSVHEDDPTQHMGRVRSFPHIRGNWPSHVFISFPEDAPTITELNKLIYDIGRSLPEWECLNAIRDKHLSLSRTLPFRHHWIESFAANLKAASRIFSSFDLYFDEFEVYTNDEKSRTFIGMKVVDSISLLTLVKKCDECLADFQLDPYYKDPSFHISCAWMLGDKSKLAKEHLIPILNQRWMKSLDSDPELQHYKVSSFEFKTGNKLYNFILQKGDVVGESPFY